MAEPSPLVRRVKVSLDETRLLIIGAQILLGFQFIGTFQDLFSALSPMVRSLHLAALVSMVICVGFLVAPTMQHRIVEKGFESTRLLRVGGEMAGVALLLFALSLGIDNFNVLQRVFGTAVGLVFGTGFMVFIAFLWFWPIWHDRAERNIIMHNEAYELNTPLSARIEQMLTEARVVLPGAQALLGFQFAVTLTHAFERLGPIEKIMHVGALSVVALAVVLLMTPAAIHRVALGGFDTEDFLRTGSRFVVGATLPLAAGIAFDLYVAVSTAIDKQWGLALAGATFLTLAILWYALPYAIKRKQDAIARNARERAVTSQEAA